jgi:geranylgeranyl diphosphate synthase type II
MTAAPDRLEHALERTIDRLTGEGCPPRLAEAIRHAVFPAGNRLRPRLCHAVATALGEDQPAVTDAAAVALELLHCASLVQDDLPAFDAAVERRGRPSVHRAFGEPLAILAADALIIGAYETIALAAPAQPSRAAALSLVLSRGVGTPGGAVAGQAWESEPEIDLQQYHRAKTAALFEAATAAGAVAAGHDPAPWRDVGTRLGQAYQVADDIADQRDTGAGSDAALGRPNAAHEMGVGASLALFNLQAASALDAIPPCRERRVVYSFVSQLIERFRAAHGLHRTGGTDTADGSELAVAR